MPDGQGGSVAGHGGTEPTTQGGSAGDAGGPGAGGEPNLAGAGGEGGAAGATATCATESGYECPPCDEGYVHTECGGPHCVCESENVLFKSDYEALLECNLDEPCPVSTQYSDIMLRNWENGECLLEALRDRTPGRYHLSMQGGIDGRVYNEVTIILDGSDEVIYFDMQTMGLAVGNLTRQYLPGSCTLKSYDELDACVAAGTDPSLSGLADDGICAELSEWTENCELLQDPQCPSE